MNCKQVYHHICENLDAEENSPGCREMRKHLATCTDCAALLDSVKKTISLYRSSPGPAVPSGVHKRLVKTIALTWESRTKSFRHPTR